MIGVSPVQPDEVVDIWRDDIGERVLSGERKHLFNRLRFSNAVEFQAKEGCLVEFPIFSVHRSTSLPNKPLGGGVPGGRSMPKRVREFSSPRSASEMQRLS